jgi:hypothetical protein
LFTENVIKEGPKDTSEPGKDFVSKLMMEHIQISEENIKAFALKHSVALQTEGVKEKIAELDKQWRDKPDFSYKEAATEIKKMLGAGIEDSDVIFMLRMFCITKPEFSNFDSNYRDLVRHLV